MTYDTKTRCIVVTQTVAGRSQGLGKLPEMENMKQGWFITVLTSMFGDAALLYAIVIGTLDG